MKRRLNRVTIRCTLGLAVCAAAVPMGCFWQRDTYTEGTGRLPGMKRSIDTWEKRQQIERLLGNRWDCPVGDFPMSIRPPKLVVPVQLPENLGPYAEAPPKLLGLFQGGDPLMEVVAVGDTTSASMQEFIAVALRRLNDTGKGPAGAATPNADVPNPVVDCLYGGQTRFDLYNGTGQRTITQGGTPVDYHWLIYFTEEPPQQRVMIAFLIPGTKYAEYTDAMQKCLETLALGSKVGAAQSGAFGSAAASTR